MEPIRRRSCMSVPGSSEKMLAKAPTRGADEIIIDLEDAVATSVKDAARETVLAALAEPQYHGVITAVRVNAPRTPWCHQDIAALGALAAGRPASIIVPKVECAGDLAFVERLLDGVEAAAAVGEPMRVQALIETAAGVDRLSEIAAASPRLDSLILGYADLSASLGRARGSSAGGELDSWRAIQDAVLVAARANDRAAIDGPYLGVAVDEGFTAAAQRARDMGFDGKWAIHPAQVPALNELFTPSADEVDHARAVIDALEQAERDGGQGAVALDGQMLDEAVRVAALRVLARSAGT